jgi:hypothetical protein
MPRRPAAQPAFFLKASATENTEITGGAKPFEDPIETTDEHG